MTRRRPASWNRRDSLVVLACYVQRPTNALLPPSPERERVANLTGHDVAEVTRRLWMYAGPDPDNCSGGEPAGSIESRLWERYRDDRMALLVAAEDAVQRGGTHPLRRLR
jgi:hypothetical protein